MRPGQTAEARLSTGQLQRLLSLVSSATSNAGQSLAAMIDQPVTIQALNVRELSFAAAQTLVGDPAEPVVGIYLIFEGGLAGQIALVFDLPTAYRLVDMLMLQEAGTTTALDELSQSALGEVGNQTGSAFLNSLADAMGVQARISPPAVLMDMAAAILNSVVAQVSAQSEKVIMLDTSFTIGQLQASGSLVVIPDQSSLEALVGGLT